MKMLAKR